MKYWQASDTELLSRKIYNLIPLELFLLRMDFEQARKDKDRKQRTAAIVRAKATIDKIISIITDLQEQQQINSDDYNKIITGLSEITRYLDSKYNLKLGGELEMIKLLVNEKIVKRAVRTEQAEEALKQAEEKNIKIIKKMLIKNTPISEIMDYGFTEQEIHNVQKTL
jgi:hypothetical protein